MTAMTAVRRRDRAAVRHLRPSVGLDALDPKWSGGTPNKIGEQTRDWICVIARCDPRFLVRPFRPLSKLRDYLIETGRVQTISIETVRRILHERGVTWPTSKT